MNQILATNEPEPPKRESYKGGKKEIGSVVKVFSIIIILVAIGIVGIGVYMFTDIGKNSQIQEGNKIPTVKQEILEDNKLKITVSHDKDLKKASYTWGNLGEVLIECEGKKQVELILDAPLGENMFKFSVEDIVGEKASLERKIVIDFGIAISINGNKTKIEAKGKEKFKYMTYGWNQEEETKVDLDDTTFVKEIDTPKGENELTVAVVDTNNKTIKKTQKIKGVLEPSIVMEYAGKDILFKVEDEEKLKSFAILKNGEEIYKQDIEEATFEYTLESNKFKHTDKIETIVTNNQGIKTTLTRPVLNVNYDQTGENVEIKAKDDVELKELKVTINNNQPRKGTTTQKSFKYLYPVKDLKSGDSMKIEVINSKNAINQIIVKLK